MRNPIINRSSESRGTSVFAILPAAGRSRRMGAPKQLLDVGGRPMLREGVETLLRARTRGVAVVLHADLAASFDFSPFPRVVVRLNNDPDSEMIQSIRIGLAEWQSRGLDPDDGILVCPADQPGLSFVDINHCILAFRQSPQRIVVATHDGRRGHPLIFPAALADVVFSHVCDSGLNQLPRLHSDRVHLVPLASPAVTRDIDTPDEYQAL